MLDNWIYFLVSFLFESHPHFLHSFNLPPGLHSCSFAVSHSSWSFVNQKLWFQAKENGVIIFGLKPKARLSWVKDFRASASH
jgi:hypothetical protein